MPNSPHLGLPYIAANQAQKHIPHNDALALLDGLLHLSVFERDVNLPPLAMVEGQRFLIGNSPTGLWAGQAGKIAMASYGQWLFLIPQKGWRAWVESEDILIAFDGTAWVGLGVPSVLQNMQMVGVNATADATNKLSVNSSAVLLNNIGNGVQVKLNKNAASDTASLLYQTGFSGRAEMGTVGDDHFHLKVSADGATWIEALVVDASTGLARVAGAPVAETGLVTKAYADNCGRIVAADLIMN